MFNNFEEFSNWLEISKNFDSNKIKDIYKFIEVFPVANFDVYINASKRIAEGESVGKVISSYRKYMQSVGEHADDSFVEISTMDERIEDMIESLNKGLLKGSSTHIDIIDACWKWRFSEFTLFTGYNADGKSIFLRFLCLIKGLKDGWKTIAYAPEDYPDINFFDELIMTASGRSTDRDNTKFIGEKLYRKTYDLIKDYFYFCNIRPPKSTIENVLNSFIPYIENEGVKICLIDPLVKITRPKEYVNNDAQWAAYVTSVCVDFARRYNVCLILVLHQLTPKLLESGVYAKPDKYSIKNGGNFSDSADNVLFLQRPEAPRDNISTLVKFGSLKIKKHRLVAIPQETIFQFSREKNRYLYENGREMFNFDSYLNYTPQKLF